jgi:transcriptional regulator with XRE-family HTH domain
VAKEVPPQRARLGARLRALRALRFRSGSEFARALGWQQTKVSKLERGVQLPKSSELELWVRETGAGSDVLAELTDLLGAARLEYRSWGDAWQTPGGIAASQDEIAELDARATQIWEYQPAMVPGLVQTVAYAREVLTVAGGPRLLGAEADQIEQRIAAQLRRQQVLYTPGKTVQLVLGEGALRTRFGERSTMVGQLDRLVSLAGLSNVEIAVLRFDTPSPVLPLAGFAINDAQVVWVETLTGEQRLDDPEEVAAYVAAFEAALTAAARGDEAIELIRAVAEATP